MSTIDKNEYDNSLIYEESKKAQSLSDGHCGVCERKGFPLFLVRKAIVPKQFKSDIDWAKGMTIEQDTALDNSQYAYRTLREGYVYILAEKNKAAWPSGTSDNLDIISYEVTRSGALRKREFRDIKGSRPKDLPKNSCLANSHQLKGLFVTIDDKLYQKVWIAYSFTRWDKETVEFYQKSDDKRVKRFTLVDLNKSNPTEMVGNNHSFSISDFTEKERYLLELECSTNEVIDYFSESEQTENMQPDDVINNLRKSNRQGIFSSVEMQDLSSLNKDAILDYCKDKFYTAHHFQSFKIDTESSGKLNESIQLFQKSDGSKNHISVIEIDDQFGIAEELSIQKRQLLSPITHEFMNSDNEKLNVLKEEYDNIKKTLSRQNIANKEKEKMNAKMEYSTFYKAFYSANILDLDNNRFYKEINSYMSKSSQMGSLLSLNLEGWITQKLSYALAKKRSQTFVDFFESAKVTAENKPLFYFKPEMSYARKQNSQINAYQAMLNTTYQQELSNDDTPCVVFAFYNSKDSHLFDSESNKQALDHQIRQMYEFFPNVSYETDTTDTRLDNFVPSAIFGLKELTTRLNIGYYPDSLHNSVTRGFSFKRLKYEGMQDFKGKSAPLGDYKIIKIDENKKKELLNLYSRLDVNDKLVIDNFSKEADDVYVIEFTEARIKVAEWKSKQKWNDKHAARVNTDSQKAFINTDHIMFNNLMDYVKDISKDYFKYCSWLFGGGSFAFWRYESQPDLSDSHINYLYSLAIILDCNYMGNIELNEQDDFFGLLFRDKETIYFHLIEGHQYSLFNVASGQVNEPELTEHVKNIILPTTPTVKKVETPDWLKKLMWVKSNRKYIMGLKLENNVKVGAYLTGEIVQISLSKATRLLTKGVIIADSDIINKNIIKSMNAFSPGIVRQYSITVPVDKVEHVIQDMKNNFSKLVAANKVQNQNIKMLSNNYKSGLTNQKYSYTKSVTKDVVVYNYYGYFETDIERLEYEKKLRYVANGEKAGTDAIFICDASKATEEQLNQAFEYMAKLERRKAIVETSIATLFSGITITSQYYALANLKAKLEAITDQQLRTKLAAKITKAHLDMVLTLTDIILNISKYTAIYLRKSDLYRLSGKVSKNVGKIGSIIALIDSARSYVDASNALTRGEEGSNVYFITSSIGLVVALAGFFTPISIPATVLIGLSIWFISLFGEYDDGLTWEQIDKWLNCSMLGKFGRQDLLPPYPITDTGLYLSDQDFYLAANGGKLELFSIELDNQTKKAEHDRLYPSYPTLYPHEWVYPRPESETFAKGDCSDLYLALHLPDFIEGTSVFEGRIEITHKYSKTKTIFTFSNENEGFAFEIRPFESISKDFLLAQKNDGMTRKIIEQYKYFEEDNAVKEYTDQKWLQMQQIVIPTNNQQQSDKIDTQNQLKDNTQRIGLFLIDQLLGRIDGAYHISCDVCYWQSGKASQDGGLNVPYLLYHQHNVNDMLETVTNYFGILES